MMHQEGPGCPSCGSIDWEFSYNDYARCDDCGENFLADVSGEPYTGTPYSVLYHSTAADPATVLVEGLDGERNPHGWVYLSETAGEWAEFLQAPTLLAVDVSGLALVHDPAGGPGDFYHEGSIAAARLTPGFAQPS